MLHIIAAHSGLLSFRSDYPAAFTEYINEMKSGGRKAVFIAKRLSVPAGLIAGTIEEKPPLFLPREYGYIPILVVLAEFRRKGVAGDLFRAVKEWFVNTGIKQIDLYTSPGNEPARSFRRSI